MGTLSTEPIDLESYFHSLQSNTSIDSRIDSASKQKSPVTLEDWDKYYSFPRFFVNADQTDIKPAPFILQPSLFSENRVPPVVYFETKLSDDSRPPVGLPKKLQALFKWKLSSITPNSIRNCTNFMNLTPIKASNTEETYFIGCWCKHMLTAEFSQLEPWKKVNHYPGSFNLGRKDKLWSRLSSASQRFGDSFGSFHPTTFILPRDYADLAKEWGSFPGRLYIMKPPASARGNGIKVINDISQIPSQISSPTNNTKKSLAIVQQYISNPCLLENGQKFDLRIYVLLTSVDPLRVYVHEEGLVRFASSKYNSEHDGIVDQYMHLTNYFVNKKNSDYRINNDCDSLVGCKWTLKRFWRYLRDQRPEVDQMQLWNNIIDIIIKTVLCCEGPITRLSKLNCRNDYSSFELFGFDIMLDSNFKPWILEVNITPSLKTESDLDTTVKYQVIKDMFNVVGYHLPTLPNSVAAKLGTIRHSSLFFDENFYKENLSQQDLIKRPKFTKKFKEMQTIEQIGESEPIWTNASPDSIRAHREDYVPEAVIAFDDTREGVEARTPEKNAGSPSSFESDQCILDDLTQNDIRVLMISEDELSRCGGFKRVYPASGSSKYLKFFDRPRYNDFLLHEWEERYGGNRIAGIKLLSASARLLN